LFLKGDENKSYLTSGAGVGYQIMVSSFADSDGDGFGDIYGIDQKLDYLKALGSMSFGLPRFSFPIPTMAMTSRIIIWSIRSSAARNRRPGSRRAASTATPLWRITNSLISDANAKGMAVIMDLVLNHTSTSNDWFIKSPSSIRPTAAIINGAIMRRNRRSKKMPIGILMAIIPIAITPNSARRCPSSIIRIKRPAMRWSTWPSIGAPWASMASGWMRSSTSSSKTK
jgi:hypothetical protein